jgi:hypothetical protein
MYNNNKRRKYSVDYNENFDGRYWRGTVMHGDYARSMNEDNMRKYGEPKYRDTRGFESYKQLHGYYPYRWKDYRNDPRPGFTYGRFTPAQYSRQKADARAWDYDNFVRSNPSIPPNQVKRAYSDYRGLMRHEKNAKNYNTSHYQRINRQSGVRKLQPARMIQYVDNTLYESDFDSVGFSDHDSDYAT